MVSFSFKKNLYKATEKNWEVQLYKGIESSYLGALKVWVI